MAQQPERHLSAAHLPDSQLPEAQLSDAQLSDAQLPEPRLSESQLPEAQPPTARPLASAAGKPGSSGARSRIAWSDCQVGNAAGCPVDSSGSGGQGVSSAGQRRLPALGVGESGN